MSQVSEQIVNPRTGQTMRFRRTAADTAGALLQVETMNPRGSGDPEHVHPNQESSAEVLAGALHFRIHGREQVVRAGEKIIIPPNTPHCFWNEVNEEAIAIQEFRPALRIEDFFRAYFALARDDKLNERGMPSMLQLAILVPAFGAEIRSTSVPWPLQRGIARLLAPIARVRGHQSIYPQDAY